MPFSATFSVGTLALILLVLPTFIITNHVVEASNDNDDDDVKDDENIIIHPPPKIFTNLNENYEASSKSLRRVNKRIEYEYKQSKLEARDYWRRIFLEIRASNPTIFPPEYEDSADPMGMRFGERRILDEWKSLVDVTENSWRDLELLFGVVDATATGSNLLHEQSPQRSGDDSRVAGYANDDDDDDVASIDDDEVDDEINPNGSEKSSPASSSSWRMRTPKRFDGFTSWEQKLQEWREDVTTYLAETVERSSTSGRGQFTESLNELFQPSAEPNSTYDLSNFGVSSQGLKRLHVDDDDDDDDKEYDDEGIEGGLDDREEEGRSTLLPRRTTRPKTKKKLLTPRRRLLSSPEKITLPITITQLVEPKLRTLPKPRPVTSSDIVLPHTDISDLTKNIWIVTTGALPWMTGTAVNPLLRAAYLSSGRKEKGGSVTLMLPWVERPEDQVRVYGSARFNTPDEQETYIRDWLATSAIMMDASSELNIRWYTAWQEVLENSLYSMGDIIGLIPETECDICILEEPEHLNWYRAPGENWTSKFKHVVGIVHTNYFVYATEQPAAFIRAPGMKLLTSWMCRAHCHRVIKLSGTLQQFCPEKELVENVHGVRRTFLDIGEDLRTKLISQNMDDDPVFSPVATPAAYFIGKMLWSKGLGSLMELIKYADESAGLQIKMDMYGGGPNKDEAATKAKKMGLDMPFHGPIDHGELGWTHKVFINPSVSEVLCTTVAEALAMGKFVVLPSHPSNDFFAQFPNCLPYSNKEEFVGNLYYALTHSPEPLTEEYSRALSWEAATERFAAAGSISVAEAEAMEEALSSAEAGIDIDLPPLTASEEQRKKISQTFTRTRARYRNFRWRLAQDITKTNVLPKDLQLKLISELDKRLDVDLDELLNSPKLRVKLSPAKLDKLLLELYDGVTKGPGGDVFRVIGGGANVGRQALYIKEQQSGKRPIYPGRMQPLEDFASFPEGPTSLVKRVLKRNLPQKHEGKEKGLPKMSLIGTKYRSNPPCGVRVVSPGKFTQSLPSRHRYVPLI